MWSVYVSNKMSWSAPIHLSRLNIHSFEVALLTMYDVLSCHFPSLEQITPSSFVEYTTWRGSEFPGSVSTGRKSKDLLKLKGNILAFWVFIFMKWLFAKLDKWFNCIWSLEFSGGKRSPNLSWYCFGPSLCIEEHNFVFKLILSPKVRSSQYFSLTSEGPINKKNIK